MNRRQFIAGSLISLGATAGADIFRRFPAKGQGNLQNLIDRGGIVTLPDGLHQLTEPLTVSQPMKIIGSRDCVIEAAAPMNSLLAINSNWTTIEGFKLHGLSQARVAIANRSPFTTIRDMHVFGGQEYTIENIGGHFLTINGGFMYGKPIWSSGANQVTIESTIYNGNSSAKWLILKDGTSHRIIGNSVESFADYALYGNLSGSITTITIEDNAFETTFATKAVMFLGGGAGLSNARIIGNYSKGDPAVELDLLIPNPYNIQDLVMHSNEFPNGTKLPTGGINWSVRNRDAKIEWNGQTGLAAIDLVKGETILVR